MPPELVDVSLCERFGWTWTELAEQDEAQVLPAVAAANVYAAVGRVKGWMEAAGGGGAGGSARPGRLEDVESCPGRIEPCLKFAPPSLST